METYIPPAKLWRAELEASVEKFHVYAVWVAIIFDPIFGFTDYLNIQEGWLNVFVIRCSIALICLVLLKFRKKWGISNFLLVFVPFVLISLQNAYTYLLIDLDKFLGHSLNYMALFIGAGMFLVWQWYYSVAMVAFSVAGTIYFVSHNPSLHSDEAFINGGLLLICVALFMCVLIQTRYALVVKEIKARLALRHSNEQLGEQKALTESFNKKMLSSIHYAKRIQESMLGEPQTLRDWFDDAFVLFKPKDIVSGDFYWFHRNEEEGIIVVAAADCTGHGVPGAFMTVMGNDALNAIVVQQGEYAPERILHQLDDKIKSNFQKQLPDQPPVNDGMDIALLVFDLNAGVLRFAGANNPLWVVSENGNKLIKGSKYPIGSSQYESKTFEGHELTLKGDAWHYVYSDGFQDQFGGMDNRKFMSKKFRALLQKYSIQKGLDQKQTLDDILQKWQGDNRQTDDILIVGIRA